MNKTVMVVLAAVLFIIGAVAGNKIGGSNVETMSLRSGTAIYDEPTAYAAHKIVAKNTDVIVLERITYGAPTMVYVNESLTVKAENGEFYRIKQGSFLKFVGVNEAEDRVTVFADDGEVHNLHLEVPKQKMYPVDEGEWTRIRDKSFGDKWVRTKSTWYDNV